MLHKPPQYMDIAAGVLQAEVGRQDDVLLLGSQQEAETMCHQFSISQPHPPTATRLPWRASKAR